MTDENRPETTPPAPDGGKPGPAGKDASLDSWFRPTRDAAEQEQGDDEAPVSAKDSASEPEDGDEAATPSVDAALTQVVRIADIRDRSEDAAKGERNDQADSSGDESDRADASDEDEGESGGGDERRDRAESKTPKPSPANDHTQVIPAAPSKPSSGPANADNDLTQVFPATPPTPANPAAAAPTQAIPRADVPSSAAPSSAKPTQAIPRADVPSSAAPSSGKPTKAIPLDDAPKARPSDSDMAVRPSTSRTPDSQANADRETENEREAEHESWSPAPGPQPQYKAPQPPKRQEPWQPQQYQSPERESEQHEPSHYQAQPQSALYQPTQQRRAQQQAQAQGYQRQRPYTQPQTQAYEAPGGVASILPPRGHGDDYDDFDNYGYADGGPERPRGRGRRALFVSLGVFVLIAAVAAALLFSGKVKVFGIGAKPVPTVGFSPSGSDAGSDATQTGTAFLTDWENGNLKAAANITDNQSAALAALTSYKNDLKVSGLTLMPGTASAQGWMTFNVTAQVGTPSSAWSYSSGMATYSSTINGYTRWFVKWQPNLMFTSLKSGQKLALGAIPPIANKVVDKNGTEITSANAPSLNGIVSALEKSAPPAAGTPGQQVQIENADGSVASKVVKLSDPVTTGAVKTTIDLNVQKAAQSAVSQAPNSSMVVIQPSTGNILAVANNPTNGLDTAMLGKYAPGSTFKTITSTLVLNKGVISDLNQTWDCPATLNADGITLHNSEQEVGVGNSFLTDFAQSCNNAFSRFEGKVSRDELVSTAHDYYGFDQKWDVGLSAPTIYGHVPNTSSNSLAEELVGQDQIQANPLIMASVAATIANGSLKQPILVPGTQQITATPLPAKTDQDLKTLMHQVVVNGTLTGILPVSGMYAKTGTAEVQGKTPNSWTIAFRGDYAVAALAVGGNFGAQTAGPEVRSLMAAVQ